MPDPVVIQIPSQFSGRTMARVTQQIAEAAVGGQPPAHLCFDFSILAFIEPTGVVFLSNLIQWLRQEKQSLVDFTGTDIARSSICYLDDCGFFASHGGGHLRHAASPRRTTIPFTRVAQPDSHAWLDRTFIPWLSSRLDQTAATLAPLRTCAAELLNNIADHTRYDIGGVAAQHFPNDDRLEIAIADFGRGIPHAVGTRRAGLTDTDAIIVATQEGFTTRSTPRNRGAGLDYLLRAIPGARLGTITIYSGRGIVCFTHSNGGVVASGSHSLGYCPGTLIQIAIQTDRIQPAIEEEDLEW